MSIDKQKRIAIIAGEASGDLHAAELVKSVHKINPNIRFTGIGGQRMREAGVDTQIDIAEISVLGIIEIIKKLKTIFRVRNKIQDYLKKEKPDLLILVDFSGFNFGLAKFTKKLNIKMLYFISPHVWAWRKYRITTIRKCIDKMAVIFPFEVDFYKQHQINATYVGNPLIKKAKPSMQPEDCYQAFNLDPQKKLSHYYLAAVKMKSNIFSLHSLKLQNY